MNLCEGATHEWPSQVWSQDCLPLQAYALLTELPPDAAPPEMLPVPLEVLDFVLVLGLSFSLLRVLSRGRNVYLRIVFHPHRCYHSLPSHIPLVNWLTPAGDVVKIHRKAIWTLFSSHPKQV